MAYVSSTSTPGRPSSVHESARLHREEMAPRNRSSGRNVHIYDFHDRTTEIGGLLLVPGITNENFHEMIEIIVIFASPFFVQDEREERLQKDQQPLQPGSYYIVSSKPFEINNEPWLVRTISQGSGRRESAFAEAVRARDRQCLVSGNLVPTFNGQEFWGGFEAAHIFPLAYYEHWKQHNYSRWINVLPDTGESINSVENGMLLRSDLHQQFDGYDFSINPDDNYKVVAFRPTGQGIEGRHLDRALFTRPGAPSAHLLRWHFRQAVLANMRGAGEPRFEHDFPPGSDIVGAILQGPKAAERMELAERILFNDNKTATGVKISSSAANPGDRSYTLGARSEVIVSGGVFGLPHLLQVSGVGPATLLEQHGIPLVADLPGVGQNLNDQFFVGISYRVNIPTLSTLGLDTYAAADAELFNTNASGRLTNPGGEHLGFEKIPEPLRSTLSASTLETLASFPADWPEIQYLTLPLYIGDLRSDGPPADGSNYATILSTLLTPTSVGNVSISSASIRDPPLINPNWLTTQSDIEVAIAGFKRLRQAWTAPELDGLRLGEEYYPGTAGVRTDAEIEAHIRSALLPIYHGSSTNKMGRAEDPLAVVDAHGRVYGGVGSLRVVDISIFPFLTPGSAPQSVVYLLAEKIADDIKNGR